FADHPAEYAAGPGEPGIAFADLSAERPPDWLIAQLGDTGSEPVLVCAHWGPNMVAEPTPPVRRAAASLGGSGVALFAGHSAHVFQGVAGRVLFDLGDFIDDYRVDPVLRNDLGLLWFVELDRDEVVSLEALPLKLDFCHTRVADGADAAWIARRFIGACSALGTRVVPHGGRLVVDLERVV
ncbi:MAG: CapA family protein, partial [Solirubrobacterales bacterium]